jgi:3-oxoacyl-[acyl-carrier-protein] synthase-3
MIKQAKIAGTGAYVPERKLTNADLERIVDTSDEWIMSRCGIKERRIVGKDEYTSKLAHIAAERALEMADIPASKVQAIIVGTITPDTMFPSTACYLQKSLGCGHAAAFDILAACSGFVYGCGIAKSWIESGQYDCVLAIGAETLTAITDYQDRNTCILFGDGAGAAVIVPSDDESGFLSMNMHSELDITEMMLLSAGGSRMPASHKTVAERKHYMRLKGREIFKFAVLRANQMLAHELETNNITMDDVKYIIPHQVNMRILRSAAGRFNMSVEKFYVNLDRYGNTSAASVPMALDEAVRAGKIVKGDLIILVAFGGGKTWASSLVRF